MEVPKSNREAKIVRKLARYGIATSAAVLSLGLLLAASTAQAIPRRQQSFDPPRVLAPGYYNYAPGYYNYAPNPALPSLGPPDPASCGGFRC
jgi:hypothetical protein